VHLLQKKPNSDNAIVKIWNGITLQNTADSVEEACKNNSKFGNIHIQAL
jgi:hypothetical protein